MTADRDAILDRLFELGQTHASDLARAAALLDYVEEHRHVLADWIWDVLATRPRTREWRRDPITFLAGSLVETLQRQNQFVTIDERARRQIEGMYEDLARKLHASLAGPDDADGLRQAIGRMVAEHLRRVDELAATLHVAHYGEGPPRAVPCAEYDPGLQLRVLGLDVDALDEPILDVGCGSAAALVQDLRERGSDAYGLDRSAPPGVPHLFVASWLEHPFEPERWSTVLSHLGFSLHFFHEHLRDEGAARRYAEKYMEILRSLQPGGLFAYAPGLPFIEDLLPPERWAVRRLPVEVPESVASIASGVPLYASQVRRADGR